MTVSPDTAAGMSVRWLGRVSFPDALAMQEEIVARKRNDPLAADEVLLLEHEPGYTIGRTPDRSSLLGERNLPHPLFSINRGGQATYHGPGQLVGYPIVDLRRCGQDLHKYLRWVEQSLIDLLAGFGLEADRRPALTGVWLEQQRKIASIGVGVRHWISMHGFALNVSGDLAPFGHIVPCGISDVTMTSMARELGHDISMIEVAAAFAKLMERAIENLRLTESPAAIDR
jgi:lipoyl(octanoyl) transferase